MRLQTATVLLAYCNMKTLYLRNVPDAVVDRLERLAQREGISVSAAAIRELADVTRRVDNADLLAALPDTSIDTDDLVDMVDKERRAR
jgi:hypothetical protein